MLLTESESGSSTASSAVSGGEVFPGDSSRTTASRLSKKEALSFLLKYEGYEESEWGAKRKRELQAEVATIMAAEAEDFQNAEGDPCDAEGNVKEQ
jgi:hypothetical protein